MIDPLLVYMSSGLPRRYCTADSPMPHEDKDHFQWGHPDAEAVQPFFNLVIYTCPHCGHTFHAEPRKPDR